MLTAELSRIELEQLARERAERLLSPQQRAAENVPERAPPRRAEPTLEERLQAIERRWLAHAQEQRRALVADALDAARKRFQAAVAVTHDVEVKRLAAEVAQCERLV